MRETEPTTVRSEPAENPLAGSVYRHKRIVQLTFAAQAQGQRGQYAGDATGNESPARDLAPVLKMSAGRVLHVISGWLCHHQIEHRNQRDKRDDAKSHPDSQQFS